ncbi:MAG: hypothetical protein Q4F28_15300 [Eubacteriales bacterium]|nr:hypothetical protein [Eubacteriales bacterium]
MGKYLYPLNFELSSDPGHQYWVFSRITEGIRQAIEIVAEKGSDYVQLRYCSMLEPLPDSVTFLLSRKGEALEKYGCYDKNRGWQYKDKPDFEKILYIYIALIDQYVLAELDRISVYDNQVMITLKNYSYLKNNAERIIENYRTEWELDGLSFEEKMMLLSRKIQELQNQKFPEIDFPLAEIGLVYGSMIISLFGGIWYWGDVNYSVNIRLIANRRIVSSPIIRAFDEWKGKGSISGDLQRIKKEIQLKDELPKWVLKKYKDKMIGQRDFFD